MDMHVWKACARAHCHTRTMVQFSGVHSHIETLQFIHAILVVVVAAYISISYVQNPRKVIFGVCVIGVHKLFIPGHTHGFVGKGSEDTQTLQTCTLSLRTCFFAFEGGHGVFVCNE
jgi:hypothetical protein